MRTGRDEAIPDAVEGLLLEAENKLSFEFRIWSRSFLSSFAAIISAAAPFGQRMIGITATSISKTRFIHIAEYLTHSNHNAE